MATADLSKLHQNAVEWHKRGEFAKAESLYSEILLQMPNAAEIHNSRGAALASLKQLVPAAQAFGHAAALQPKNENFRYNYANALKEQGLVSQAIEQFLEVVRIKPDHIPARIQLGLLYQYQKEWRNAMEQFNYICNANTGMVEAFEQLGYCLLKMLRFGDAEGVFRHVLKISPSNIRGYQGLTRALMGLNRTAEAVGYIREALQVHPNDHMLQIGLGRALAEMGDQEQAISVFESIIRSKPEDIEAYNELALLRKFRKDDELLISTMERLLESQQLTSDDLVSTNFSLGKVYDDIGIYDKAFHFYNEGNHIQLNRLQLPFRMEDFRADVSSIISCFNRDFFARHTEMGHDSEVPIFVVGMPRSGTTLTEQILASHPDVTGAGEVNFWNSARVMLPIELSTDQPYPECIEFLNSNAALQIGDKYLDMLHQLVSVKGSLRIVDKMPQNFFYMGLIAVIFPKAKFIHIQRDAMDNSLSIYFQNFEDGHPYSYDLENIGSYYREYQRLMQHWRKVLPIKMLEINYEDLVTNQEVVTRQLIEYIGLEWDDRCLQPEKTQKAVRTASLWQARQPVYKTSVARWKRYEKHLGPLKQALGLPE